MNLSLGVNLRKMRDPTIKRYGKMFRKCTLEEKFARSSPNYSLLIISHQRKEFCDFDNKMETNTVDIYIRIRR